jgi:hypothetical protein
MLGCFAGACASVGVAAPSANAPLATNMVNRRFSLISSLQCVD